jgi:MinD-like ATPase involved in chromosome partitioning or flagellar assembly
MAGPGGAVSVLVAAGGAAWETDALEMLSRRGSGVTVHRRCVDLADLLAAARTEMASVALVTAELAGLDADAVDSLGRCGVGVVAVARDGDAVTPERLRRLGVRRILEPDLAGLLAAVTELGEQAEEPTEDATPSAGHDPQESRSVVVWGPSGAPGRTTVAVAVAAEIAHRGGSVLLVDADPYGGTVGQHLGVLDGVSGLLAAARLANAGRLDPTTLAASARSVTTGADGSGSVRVLTGLPRPDRWSEVRPAAFEELLDVAGQIAREVVVDVGFSVEGDAGDPFGTAPQRNAMTLTALERADRVLVVGTADPVGLARLARGLVDLHDQVPGANVHVVVNRVRPSLGWSEKEVRGMVEGFVGPVPVSFLPEDRVTADRALMAGRSLVELGDSPLRRGVAALVDGWYGGSSRRSRRTPRLRRRRAGTGR